MGTRTNGQICYGVVFEEEYRFPWDADDYDGDMEDWWIVESGWTGDSPYDESGELLPGLDPGDIRISEYHDSQYAWRKSHPCPVVLVNYQSGEVPAYILACPPTEKTARRGYPQRFEPDELVVPEEERRALAEFCERYGLVPEGEAGWYLTSYWG